MATVGREAMEVAEARAEAKDAREVAEARAAEVTAP